MAGKRKKALTKQEKRRNEVRLIVQSNDLIEAKYMFDVWEMRFFYSLVSLIEKNDKEDKVYRVWLGEVKKMFKLNNNRLYDNLRNAAKSLAKKNVYIGYKTDTGLEREKMRRFIKEVDYLKEGEEHKGKNSQEYVDVLLDEDMLPYLLYVKSKFDPKVTRYTSYKIRNIIKLKPYATRMYELLKQYEYAGERTLIIKGLKDMFNITNEYPKFYDFYRKVILKSIQDINKHTDLYIPLDKIEKIKRGRTVHAILFIIEAKPQKEIDALRGIGEQQSLFDANDLQPNAVVIEGTEIIEPIEKEQEAESDRLYNQFEEVVVKKYGITPVRFVSMLSTGKYDEVAIQQAIDVTNRAKFKKKLTNVAGYFMSALKDGYTDEKIDEKKRKKEAEAKNKVKKKKIAELQKKKDALEDAYAKKLNERVNEVDTNDPQIIEGAILWMRKESRTKVLIQKEENKLGRAMELDDFKESKVLRGQFRNAIILSNQDSFADIADEFQPEIKEIEKQIALIKRGK